MTKPVKRPQAKRKLSNISFDNEGAHLALVSKEVGGPANGHDAALILKSTNQFSEEFIQKFQQVKVTMDLPEFLQRFFNLYYDDSMILATLMGYEDQENSQDDPESFSDYIEERVKSIELMKKLHKSEDISSVISEFSENDYLTLLQDQEGLEKFISKANLIVNKGFKNKVPQEETMTTKTEKDLVEKSTLEAIQKAAEQEKETLTKALTEQKEQLQKALDTVKQFEQEKKEAITKSRFTSVKEAVKDEAKAEVLFKALNLVEDAAEFEAVVKALKDMSDLAEKGELFIEKGVSAEGEGTDSNPVTAVIKQLNKTNKK